MSAGKSRPAEGRSRSDASSKGAKPPKGAGSLKRAESPKAKEAEPSKEEARRRRAARRGEQIARLGRQCIWVLPVFGLVAGVAGQTLAIPEAVLGVLSAPALAAVLHEGRARSLALAGLISALAGAGATLAAAGTLVMWPEMAPAGGFELVLAQAGAGALIGGWALCGVAVFRTGGLSRVDGVLLVVSAPMLYAGGPALGMIPRLGAFLLLAAGLGIGMSAARVVPAGQLDVAPPRLARRASSRSATGAGPDLDLLPAATLAQVEAEAATQAGPTGRKGPATGQNDGRAAHHRDH